MIPVKSFQLAKGRLATAIPAETRARMSRELAMRTVEASRSAAFSPLVVAGDAAVLAWCRDNDVDAIADPGGGLDQAAASGIDGNGKWVVIHADLPLLDGEDLAAIASVIETGREVIAPSSDGGTSVIGAARDIAFAYGPGSFHRHLARLIEPVIVARVGLLLDIDSGADLEAARAHPHGAWLNALIRAAI